MSSLITHFRGDTFQLSITLGGGWLASHFTEMWFTVRSDLPADTVTDDTGALSQVTLSGGGLVFAGGGASGTATIAASSTALWPTGSGAGRKLYWDLQGVTSEGKVYTIASGTILCRRDVTRTAPITTLVIAGSGNQVIAGSGNLVVASK